MLRDTMETTLNRQTITMMPATDREVAASGVFWRKLLEDSEMAGATLAVGELTGAMWITVLVSANDGVKLSRAVDANGDFENDDDFENEDDVEVEDGVGAGVDVDASLDEVDVGEVVDSDEVSVLDVVVDVDVGVLRGVSDGKGVRDVNFGVSERVESLSGTTRLAVGSRILANLFTAFGTVATSAPNSSSPRTPLPLEGITD